MRELQGIAGFISDLPDLSMGLEQAQSLVYKHLDFVADLVQAKIEAGTADDNRPFTVTQAQNVLQTAKVIGRLASLVMPDGQQQEDAVRNDVLKGLQSLLGLVQDMFGRDVGESVPLAVQEFLRRLSKLSVWKAAHVDFGMPYDTACSVANNSFAAVACLVEDSQVGADLLMKPSSCSSTCNTCGSTPSSFAMRSFCWREACWKMKCLLQPASIISRLR